ncbi:MAG: hypothetical protein FK730_16460 [Asgard group archaeon]|nr:hypothetical protein [Asgard group archaeon]
MSTKDVGKKQLMTPYLVIGGVTILVYAIIILHDAINAFVTETSINYYEYLIGNICFLIGLAFIIVMMVLILIVHEKRVYIIIGAIIMLVLFIAYNIALAFFPDLLSSVDKWVLIFIPISYGVIRGIAFTMTNRALNVPLPRYGIVAFGFFGWTFLVTTSLSFLFTYIGIVIESWGLVGFALILLIIQYFIDALCLGIIGIYFIWNALYYPIIKDRIAIKPEIVLTKKIPFLMRKHHKIVYFFEDMGAIDEANAIPLEKFDEIINYLTDYKNQVFNRLIKKNVILKNPKDLFYLNLENFEEYKKWHFIVAVSIIIPSILFSLLGIAWILTAV